MVGDPAQPVDMNALEVDLMNRKWDKSFDNFMKGAALTDGAWMMTHGYRYLSGSNIGWTWNIKVKLVYSSTPITGAMPYMEGLYVVQYREYLTAPDGSEQVLVDLCDCPPSLGNGHYIHLN